MCATYNNTQDLSYHLSIEGCFAPKAARAYAAEIAAGLAHMHKVGVLNRDLKPSNASSAGTVYRDTFGPHLLSSMGYTSTVFIVQWTGTVKYMIHRSKGLDSSTFRTE